MHIRNLTRKLDIAYVIKDKWHLPVHKHTHYELQYIIRGKGQHIINGHSYNYERGDLFILPPQDNHFFIFRERSAICIIKFNEGLFENFSQDAEFKQLLSNFSSPWRKMKLSAECRKNAGQLMELIIKEHKKASVHQNIIIKSALGLILALMSEDAGITLPKNKNEKIQVILSYIDLHITERELLSTQKIAEKFNINKTYFNQYFTKATGCSYKKYVQEYALNLIAQRLVYQDKTLSQLADEFGYTDESHLSNVFKAHFNQTPSAFRKGHRQS
jgi:AraC-like DNA-binding protein